MDSESSEEDLEFSVISKPSQIRKNHALWKQFERGTEKYKKTNCFVAYCIACTASTGTRKALKGEKFHLEKHLDKCPSIADSIRRRVRSEMEAELAHDATPLKVPTRSKSTSSGLTSKSKFGNLGSFVDTEMDPNEKQEFHNQLEKAFISAGIPFSAVEDEEFKKALCLIRPTVKLPTRQSMAGILLDSQVKHADQALEKTLRNNEFVNITFDGWKDITSKKILGRFRS